MERRTLRFHNSGDVLADAESLLRSGYDRAGNWNLGQVCHHLATVVEMSLDGFPIRFPWPVRLAARWLVLGSVLRHQPFRRRVAAPRAIQPPDAADDAEGLGR